MGDYSIAYADGPLAELAATPRKVIPIELEHPSYRAALAQRVPGIDSRIHRARMSHLQILRAFGEVLFEDMLRRRAAKEKADAGEA